MSRNERSDEGKLLILVICGLIAFALLFYAVVSLMYILALASIVGSIWLISELLNSNSDGWLQVVGFIMILAIGGFTTIFFLAQAGALLNGPLAPIANNILNHSVDLVQIGAKVK